MTFFIKNEDILVFLTHKTKYQIKMINQLTQSICNNDDIAVHLKTLLIRCANNTSFNVKKALCRVVIVNQQVRYQRIDLPNIDLKPFEIEHYIQASLVKIFKEEQELAYDYQITKHYHKSLSLMIYAYPQHLLACLIPVFEHCKLQFIGMLHELMIPTDQSDNLSSVCETMACLPNLSGFNLLPWRKSFFRKKMICLTTITLSGAIIVILSLLYVYWHIDNQLEEQLVTNRVLRIEVEQKQTYLSSLILLAKTSEQLQSKIEIRQQTQRQLTVLINRIILTTQIVPTDLWFTAFVYRDQIIELKGESFLIQPILTFVRLLNEEVTVESADLLSIKHHQSLQKFNLKIKFSQNN